MTTIIHRTPGELDTRSFTVSGMSAKPGTTTPIGQFGTGLKYAIAGLLRSGAQVSIWISREHWQFELEETTFRGAAFQQIIAWRRAWGGLRRQKILLPFTTQLGPHWVDWMWMRELHSNTLDEGGTTLESADRWTELGEQVWEVDRGEDGTEWLRPCEGTTTIAVTSPGYAAAWEARADVFLPGATGPAGAAGRVLEHIPGPGQRVYYRGLRVLDLRLPSVRTWNILVTTPLTEDRTMSEWYARYHLANWIATECTDQALIQEVVEAEDGYWEHELEFQAHMRPSDLFSRVVNGSRRASGRATSYYGGWAPRPAPDTRPLLERRGRQWQLAEEEILDQHGRLLMARPDNVPSEDWREIASTLIAAVAPQPEGSCPTCHQPMPLQHRAMVPDDIYVGLGMHEWHYDYEREPTHIECRKCHVVLTDDNSDRYYGNCEPPAWMIAGSDPDPDDTTFG